MALSTITDITTEFLVRGQQSTTSGFLNDTTINNWIKSRHRWAASAKKWPFTEGRVSTTFASLATDEDGNLRGEYPEGWKPDSIRWLTIDGKKIQKIQFQQFQQFRELEPDSNKRRFTDYGRLYYINPNIDVSGSVALWGQYTPTDIDTTDNVATTIFSNVDEDGNEAIVEAMLSDLKARSNDPQQAQQHMAKANALLQGVWDRITQEQPNYHNGDVGLFEHFDVLQGGYREDVVNPRQW